MDPWDEWRRKRRPGDPFAEFEAEFEQMRTYFNKVFQDVMQNAHALPRQMAPGQPFVYGFSMRVGPDGKPHIEQFGNTGPVAPGPGSPTAEPLREPITDVLEGADSIAITAELPGVEKKDINLHVAEERVTIRVDAPRKYHKAIALPAKVKPDTAKATYKNGILDVQIERAEKREDPGHKVDIG